MVNKQYSIQKQKQHNSNVVAKHHSPPPVRNPSIISNTPNPISYNLCDASSDKKLSEKKILDTPNGENKLNKLGASTYERNIALGNKIFGSREAIQRTQSSKDDEGQYTDQRPRFMLKDHLEINDIGRFQYIVQMDKEMGSHPSNLYRIPPRVPFSRSSSSSTNSTNNSMSFWKAGSESPITTSPSKYQRKRDEINQLFKDLWKYSKWPLLIILCAILLGTSIYFLVNDSNRPTRRSPFASLNLTKTHTSTESSVEASVFQEENSTLEDLIMEDEDDENRLRFGEVELRTNAADFKPHEKTTHPTTLFRTRPQYEHHSTQSSVTTVSPSRNTQILQIYTHPGAQFEEDLRATTEVLTNEKEGSVDPTKESFDTIGFTSGHQNNFGVPIEEDERILKMLNEELLKHEAEEKNHTYKPTTESSTDRPHVSPTLPVLLHSSFWTTERLSVNSTDVGNCQSTSLSICRGILQYDLTVNKSRRTLTATEQDHFKYLFDSKCSSRAAEFVCSALEPECRPSQMGVLKPCKRICKSILEPCASIIASSEVLTTTFDCDSYPDSSDRNVCEDPTRRGRCHDNEFKCLDSTCIPLQWKCDNIKDCSLGEDEENCLFCEHEEFRCQSNDKCIPDKWRCDQYNDCPDGSDEMDCDDYDDEMAGVDGERPTNPREFAFASVQEPNSPKNKPYLTISSGDSHLSSAEEEEAFDDRFLPTASDSGANEASQEDSDEIQKGEASGRVVVGVPRNIANFQDSKEIMMTSDSENDFKYSKANRSATFRSKTTTTTTTTSTTEKPEELTQGPNQCPTGELRCVSGKCITVDQLCDKTIDCPDGADEAMCVYKET